MEAARAGEAGKGFSVVANGQGTGQGDSPGDRGHRSEDPEYPGRHVGRHRLDLPHRRHDHAHQRRHVRNRECGRRTDRNRKRDRPQRQRGRKGSR
ncbi:MAG: hypothetical protein ACM3ZF_16930 [Mycobacterium leprae]